MAKYFRRYRPNGATFYIDERGKEVSEATALTNLSESGGSGTRLRETVRLSEPAREQKELRERCAQTRANLEEAFKRPGLFGGMSDAEARLAAKGREV